MKCMECNEEPATLHFTKFIDGTKEEIHLCQSCAIKREEAIVDESYTLHDLLTGLFNFEAGQVDMNMQAFQKKEEKDLICSNCELTFNEFRHIGTFGCSDCYSSFKSKLNPIFKRVHSGNIRHIGKIPKRGGQVLHKKKELESYRNELNKLIIDENFEKAAVIRDKIKEIEQATD